MLLKVDNEEHNCQSCDSGDAKYKPSHRHQDNKLIVIFRDPKSIQHY